MREHLKVALKAAKSLVELGVDVKARDDNGGTALMVAPHRGLAKVIKLLIDSGADVNEQDASGRTPLINAATCGHTKTAKLLLEKGADPNSLTFGHPDTASRSGHTPRSTTPSRGTTRRPSTRCARKGRWSRIGSSSLARL